MPNQFRQVEVINKETQKKQELLEQPDGTYVDKTGRVFQNDEINNADNIVIPEFTPEEQYKQSIEDFKNSDRPSIGTPRGNVIPIDQKNRSEIKVEFNRDNEDGSTTLMSVEYQSRDVIDRSVSVRNDFVTGSGNKLNLYTFSSKVNRPNPNNPFAVNEGVVKFGDLELPHLSSKGLYTGHANLAEVCVKAKFAEQCISAGIDSKKLSIGAKRNIDSSQTYSYGFGSTTITKESINEVREIEKCVIKEFKEVKTDIKEKHHDVVGILKTLMNDNLKFAEWVNSLHNHGL